MGGSAERHAVRLASDAFVRGAPRASFWRGALPSHDSIWVHFGCWHAPLRFAQGRGTNEGVRSYTIFSPTALA